MKLIDNVLNFNNTEKRCNKMNVNNINSFFALILMILTLFPVSTNAQSWLAGYDYRRALTITNSGSSVTDYQVKIQLNSSNFNDNFPQANGEDIRITAADGTTLLPLWIESWSSNQGVIWTKIPSVPASTSTIFIYYGNNSVPSASNGNNTFSLFEDSWIINPVHRTSQPSWEVSVTYPMVFKEGSNYYMLFDGHGPALNSYHDAKGLATSTDLINWNAYASNPVIGYDTAGTDHDGAGEYAWGDIIKVSSTYHLYPSKGPGTTVHATSTNLIDWTGFTTLGTSDPMGIGSGAAILKEGDGVTPVLVNGAYWMVYNHGANPGDIYMAFSYDLNYWINANNNKPILRRNIGAWDEILFSPSFIKIGSTYYIFYQGAVAASPGTTWSIGFASASTTSSLSDTLAWTKYAGNPVISGNHGWDNPIAIDPEFRSFDGTYYLFYTGFGGKNGFATSTTPEGPYSQSSNTWVKGIYGGIPTVSGGIISIDSAQNIQTQSLSYSVDNALGFRGNFHNDISGYKWAGFINGENAPFLTYQVDPGQSWLTFIAGTAAINKVTQNVGTESLNGFHNFEIGWTSSLGVAKIDDQIKSVIFSSPPIPPGPLPINFHNLNNANRTFDVDWMYLRKFSGLTEPSVTTVGAEQSAGVTVNAKVYLEGPYSGGGAMTTSLNSILPLNSNTAYSTATYGYTASVVGSIPNANIVDWVLIELRTGTAFRNKSSYTCSFS